MESIATDLSATHSDLELLTFEQLEARLKQFSSDERMAVAQFLVHLAEVDRRRGFSAAGTDTLWDFVRTKLGFPECQTFLRVNAAKVVGAFPEVLPRILSGSLTLSALASLKKSVLPNEEPVASDVAATLFDAASGLSTRKVDRLLRAKRAPRSRPPDGFSPCRPPTMTVVTPEQLALRKDADQLVKLTVDETGKKTFVSIVPGAHVLVSGIDPKNELVPISDGQKELKVTVVGDELEIALQEMAFLIGHDPNDYAGLVQRAVKSQVRRLKKQKGLDPNESILDVQKAAREEAEKEAATPPAQSASEAEEAALEEAVVEEIAAELGRRHIPAELKGEIMRRAKFCCELVLANGKRCCSTRFCQFDHKTPVSLGGKTDLENLRFLCRRCNLLEARRILGDEWVDQCIARNRAKRNSTGQEPLRAHEVN